MVHYGSFYQEHGYAVLDGYVSERECNRLRARISGLVEECPALLPPPEEVADQAFSWEKYYDNNPDKICLFFEKAAFSPQGRLLLPKEQSVYKVSPKLHLADPFFAQFVSSLKISSILKPLGDKFPQIIQSMYLIKQARIGSETRCHQDSSYLFTEPNTLIGLWIALDDATVENGCLWVLPGGQNAPLKYRFYRRDDGILDYLIFDETPWDIPLMIPLEVPKGSLVMLHGMLPHMSLSNRSERTRHAFALHLYDSSSHFYPSNWIA